MYTHLPLSNTHRDGSRGSLGQEPVAAIEGIDWSQVPDSQVPARRVGSSTDRPPRRGFIPPIPLPWFQAACRLPGKAPIVAAVLWYLSRLKKSPTVLLTQNRLKDFGVSRAAKYRSLQALQAAGLIAVLPRGRKNPEITVLDPSA